MTGKKQEKLIVRKISFQGKDFEIFMRPDADESVMAEIFRWREYKSAEEIIRCSHLPILDVGAHIGIFSLYAKALNPLAEIFALEPEKDNFSLLSKNIRANRLEGVKISRLALAGEEGVRDLMITPDSINHHLRSAGQEAGNASDGIEKVATIELGGFLERNGIASLGLMKMDIEGGEYEVFDQLRPEDFAKIRNLVMEYHDYDGRDHRQIEKMLRGQGFSVQIFPSRFEKGLGFLLARNRRQG